MPELWCFFGLLSLGSWVGSTSAVGKNKYFLSNTKKGTILEYSTVLVHPCAMLLSYGIPST